MKLRNDKMSKETVEDIIADIKRIDEHISNISAAQSYLHSGFSRYRDSEDRIHSGNLLSALYMEQNRLFRNLFMFGLVVDKRTRDKIKAIAYDRYIKDHHFYPTMNRHRVSYDMEEQEFDRACRSLFAPETAIKLEKELMKDLGLKNPNNVTNVIKDIKCSLNDKTDRKGSIL